MINWDAGNEHRITGQYDPVYRPIGGNRATKENATAGAAQTALEGFEKRTIDTDGNGVPDKTTEQAIFEWLCGSNKDLAARLPKFYKLDTEVPMPAGGAKAEIAPSVDVKGA